MKDEWKKLITDTGKKSVTTNTRKCMNENIAIEKQDENVTYQ